MSDLRAAPCSRRFKRHLESTRHGTAIAADELFLGDSTQDDSQPPLSQSDLVLWHEDDVPADGYPRRLTGVKQT